VAKSANVVQSVEVNRTNVSARAQESVTVVQIVSVDHVKVNKQQSNKKMERRNVIVVESVDAVNIVWIVVRNATVLVEIVNVVNIVVVVE